ncbi:MAG: FIST C-terminal domain-containing protein [Candidatus Omnitrophica bacterium]|nr:FIST C-terminal domain-containing protein [Candidatus Omnitrophota bacterium]
MAVSEEKKEQFAIACSERTSEEDAIKEISLAIKTAFPRTVDFALVFFTPHYKPLLIQKALKLTLKPVTLIAIEAPLLIYEYKTIEHGIVVACMDLGKIKLATTALNEDKVESIEVALRKTRQEIRPFDLLLGFLSPKINYDHCIGGLKFAFGKTARVLTAGYEENPDVHYQHLLNDRIENGYLYFAISAGFNIHYEKISGFLPLGMPFTFTKVDRERNLILEIDHKPAVEIYRKYLEDKFEIFLKKKLCYLYPFGIKSAGQYRLVSIEDILEGDSLKYLGHVEEGFQARLMMINEDLLGETILDLMAAVKEKLAPKLVIIVSSLVRKQILKQKTDREIGIIKKVIGKDSNVIGFYSDYQIIFDEASKEFIIEKGDLHVTFWGNK